MSLWVVYRHFDADINCRNIDAATNLSCGAGYNLGKNSLDSFDLLKVGGMINF